MTLAIGVDGGGTLTRAVLIDGRGTELSRGGSSGAVVTAGAPEAAAKAVSEAVHAAAERGGVALPVGGLWAGLAGASLAAGRQTVAAELEAAGLAERVVVGTDVEAAFHDAFGQGPGILLIAGTGSIAWGRNATGAVVRVGGWGERLGDEGSGFAIGAGALRAIALADDGRGPATALRQLVLEHLSIDRTDGLIGWAATATKGAVAALAPLVSRASTADDPAAAAILATAVADLCLHLDTVLDRTGPWPEPPELVLWGGLIGHGGPLRDAVADAVDAYSVRLSSDDLDPAMGAAKLALATLSDARLDP